MTTIFLGMPIDPSPRFWIRQYFRVLTGLHSQRLRGADHVNTRADLLDLLRGIIHNRFQSGLHKQLLRIVSSRLDLDSSSRAPFRPTT